MNCLLGTWAIYADYDRLMRFDDDVVVLQHASRHNPIGGPVLQEPMPNGIIR